MIHNNLFLRGWGKKKIASNHFGLLRRPSNTLNLVTRGVVGPQSAASSAAAVAAAAAAAAAGGHPSYSDLLLKTYESTLMSRYGMTSPMTTFNPALCSPLTLSMAAATSPAVGPFGVSMRGPLTHLSIPAPPPGSFQHLLASMTSSAAKARETYVDLSSPVSAQPPPPPVTSQAGTVTSSSPPDDRRSSSIASLRLKAREHEIRMGGNVRGCNDPSVTRFCPSEDEARARN
ncbi:hypothetical protein C0Q70_21438 [Pomacea canaliculata]|uniref:OAR domain-containing protein n=1 Tax=Pomacea canaliculata TaxID=400727 RepID=A0A2T7NCI8_POMCA|nr:hypothetical protein C0Q70_21438 [Pomacea canaliculata]